MESFLLYNMIDFYLSKNREAIVLCMNETKARIVFSQSSPYTYFDSWDFIQLLSESVWGINLTLYSIHTAIYNLQDLSESLSKRKREREKKTSSLMAVD